MAVMRFLGIFAVLLISHSSLCSAYQYYEYDEGPVEDWSVGSRPYPRKPHIQNSGPYGINVGFPGGTVRGNIENFGNGPWIPAESNVQLVHEMKKREIGVVQEWPSYKVRNKRFMSWLVPVATSIINRPPPPKPSHQQTAGDNGINLGFAGGSVGGDVGNFGNRPWVPPQGK